MVIQRGSTMKEEKNGYKLQREKKKQKTPKRSYLCYTCLILSSKLQISKVLPNFLGSELCIC